MIEIEDSGQGPEVVVAPETQELDDEELYITDFKLLHQGKLHVKEKVRMIGMTRLFSSWRNGGRSILSIR